MYDQLTHAEINTISFN